MKLTTEEWKALLYTECVTCPHCGGGGGVWASTRKKGRRQGRRRDFASRQFNKCVRCKNWRRIAEQLGVTLPSERAINRVTLHNTDRPRSGDLAFRAAMERRERAAQNGRHG